jgi:hypothetical protein
MQKTERISVLGVIDRVERRLDPKATADLMPGTACCSCTCTCTWGRGGGGKVDAVLSG